jgi:hypothetical protein
VFRWLAQLFTRFSAGQARTVQLAGDGAFDFEVVGEARCQDVLALLAGGRSRNNADVKCRARLVREPNNKSDRRAVAVYIEGHRIAYLYRERAREYHVKGNAECNAVICGGWDRGPNDQGHFGVKLDLLWPPQIRR